MATLELRHVTKRFGGAIAVNDASFSVDDGEFFILVGPSGCGKSTLLNLVVGLEEPSDGEIRVDGRRVDGLDPKDRDMAMVFQSYAIYPHMTVRDNMAFPLRLSGMGDVEIAARIREVARRLELVPFLDRKPRALSGGQRQRVAMGRALVRDPSVFLLDEPLSNLDARLRLQTRVEIARLQRQLKTTTIYVTHDQTEAMTLGDRIAVMRRGEVVQIGTPRELYEHPRDLFVAGFIGAPAMNFVPARLVDGIVETPLGDFERPWAAGKAELIAGFRPEQVRVRENGQSEAQATGFEARVELVEWLGSDLYIYFDIDLQGFHDVSLPVDLDPGRAGYARNTLVARVDPRRGVGEGDVVHLRLDPGDIHLFDVASGVRLGREAGKQVSG